MNRKKYVHIYAGGGGGWLREGGRQVEVRTQ